MLKFSGDADAMPDRAFSPDDLSEMPEIPCIYEIVNLNDGHRYVGQAINFRQRSREHVRLLDAGKDLTNRDGLLQKAWSRDGRAAFVFRILEVIDDNRLHTQYQIRPDNLNLAEHYHISKNRDGDYNRDSRIVRDSFKSLIEQKAWREPIDEKTRALIREANPRAYLVGKRRGYAHPVIVLGFGVDDAKTIARRLDADINNFGGNLSTLRLSAAGVAKWLQNGAKDLRNTK